MRDLTHHQNRQTLNQNTDFTVESIIYPVGPGAQLGASPSITRSATAQHRERPGYLLVVGELRFALSGQRVGPVLSHGPLLRWHGFHQGAIYPRLGAHAPRIPIMREIFFRFPSTKKKFYPAAESGTRSRCESMAARVISASVRAVRLLCERALFDLRRCAHGPPRLKSDGVMYRCCCGTTKHFRSSSSK